MRILSSFASIQKALRSLLAEQRAMDAVTRNVAAASDPHHTRLEVDRNLLAGPALLRLRNAFLDGDYRRAAGAAGGARVRQESLSRIEVALAEPSENGLQAYLDRFWEAWRQLGADPLDLHLRAQAVAAAGAAASRIRQVAAALADERARLDAQLAAAVAEVNGQAARVASLNQQITAGRASGIDVSSLQDSRDAALDQLAVLTGATAVESGDGQVAVYVGGQVLVAGGAEAQMKLDDAGKLVWGQHGDPVVFHDGELAGLIDSRDLHLTEVASALDLLAEGLAASVNSQHRLGYGLDPAAGSGRDIFVHSGGAISFGLAPGITPDTLAVAGAPERAPGDGRIAEAVAALRANPVVQSPLVPGRLVTVDQHYRSLVGRLGTMGQASRLQKEATELDVQAVNRERQSRWGVSVDEEAANLLQSQKAFMASARVMSTLDESLDTIINRMGAGR